MTCCPDPQIHGMLRTAARRVRIHLCGCKRTIAKLLGHKSLGAVKHYRKMSKYDRMIETNKERSDEKVASAKRAIRKLMEDGERISVPQLMKMPGLSRGFFYKNAIVRAEIDHAMEQQAGTVDPRRNILDQAMDNRIELLQSSKEASFIMGIIAYTIKVFAMWAKAQYNLSDSSVSST